MSQFDIIMPKLGESITEATITKWFKKENDLVEEDDVLLEIATDKVDSEIPSPVAGRITKILFKEGDIVPVGKVIAIILMGSDGVEQPVYEEAKSLDSVSNGQQVTVKPVKEEAVVAAPSKSSERFYSPVIRSIAKEENIKTDELESLTGSGLNGRLTKQDVLKYLSERSQKVAVKTEPAKPKSAEPAISETQRAPLSVGATDEIIEMDRMRRIIADHMVMSKHTAPHVTNFVEADVTNIVSWRNNNKEEFQRREKIKLTYMPVFLEAIVKALQEYPYVNSSVDGYKIILRKNINIGIAVALPTGNLIVPVIKNADNLNLGGLAKEVNRLANAARTNKLSPDDVQGGTFSLSNFGTFKNSFGTPIIPQPQVAILATGAIEKKPAVVETSIGDVIAIRHKMFLSLSYDHRIVDGGLGGAFLRKIADYLEQFDTTRTI